MKKYIRTTITLVDDEFDDGSNQIVAEGLRTICMIQFGGGAVMPVADITIYGLAMESMLKLTRIRWRDIASMQNMIKVEARAEGEEYKVVFEGNLTFGYIDMSNVPDVAFRIKSIAGIFNAYNPVPPDSWEGEHSVVQAIADITERMGCSFENSGVPESLTMRDVTLVDADLNKIRKLCRAYEIDLYVEQDNIAIASQGSPRDIPVPLLTPKNGMMGYPIPTMQGIDVRCLYNPTVRFGGVIRIADSLITSANGDWRVFGVTINIESEQPGGNWFMDIRATTNEANDVAISK